jgi:hypothetical protein
MTDRTQDTSDAVARVNDEGKEDGAERKKSKAIMRNDQI